MFAVKEYFNYGKDVSMDILNITIDKDHAKNLAMEHAENNNNHGEKIVECNAPDTEFLYIESDYQVTYINNHSGIGYERSVYAVVQLPEVEGNSFIPQI